MEIQPHTGPQSHGNEKAGNLKEGETVRLQVKERISANEAIVKVRGTEIRASFEGKIPAGDKVNVEVKQISPEGIRVKPIEEKQSGEQKHQMREKDAGNARQLLKELGMKDPSRELVRATQQLISRDTPLNRETVRDLNNYIEKGPGTPQEKAQTIHMMAQKKLEPSAAQLKSVHEAMHGQRIHDIVRQISGNAPADTAGKGMNRQSAAAYSPIAHTPGKTTPEVQQAAEQVRSSLVNGSNLRQSIENLQQAAKRSGDKNLLQNVNQQLRNMITVQAQSGRLAAAAAFTEFLPDAGAGKTDATAVSQSLPEQWISKLEQSSDIRPVLQQIQQQAAASGLEKPLLNLLTQGIDKANQYLSEGRELKARQTIADSLQQLPKPSADQAAQMPPIKEMENFMRNEVLAPAGIEAKAFLVTEVTEKLAKATDQFRSFQRDSVNQLQKIEQVLQQVRQQAVPIVRPMMENVINQLDKAINKSDWLLYADMKQERKLLGASSQLAEAKNLLAKGQTQEARQLIREVRQVIEQIQFKPSNQKVQHIVSERMRQEESHQPRQSLSRQLDNAARTLTYNDHSPRQVLEGMRSLGLNREPELSQSLAQGKIPTEQQQRDMKSLLLQMAKGTDDEGSRQAQQAVSNLNGQQLLNRQESSQLMHLFHLPMQLKDGLEELKVFVNGKNGGEEVDWENMNLYFHIDTKKLGPLGIALNVSNRQLSITLKNDTPDFENKVLPLTEKYIENLNEVGFQVQGVKTQHLETTEKEEQSQEPELTTAVMTEKGFDYKV